MNASSPSSMFTKCRSEGTRARISSSSAPKDE